TRRRQPMVLRRSHRRGGGGGAHSWRLRPPDGGRPSVPRRLSPAGLRARREACRASAPHRDARPGSGQIATRVYSLLEHETTLSTYKGSDPLYVDTCPYAAARSTELRARTDMRRVPSARAPDAAGPDGTGGTSPNHPRAPPLRRRSPARSAARWRPRGSK